jgi:hypothetical protein
MMIPKQVAKEILQVRASGETNMFDINNVFSIANRKELFYLVSFLAEEDNRKTYSNFIITGEGAEVSEESC